MVHNVTNDELGTPYLSLHDISTYSSSYSDQYGAMVYRYKCKVRHTPMADEEIRELERIWLEGNVLLSAGIANQDHYTMYDAKDYYSVRIDDIEYYYDRGIYTLAEVDFSFSVLESGYSIPEMVEEGLIEYPYDMFSDALAETVSKKEVRINQFVSSESDYRVEFKLVLISDFWKRYAIEV